jgi:hypothetical protein
MDSDDDVIYSEAPAHIETYPTVVYAGETHYYVEGRWYRHSARGWGYYRREPAHLAKHRPSPHEERR